MARSEARYGVLVAKDVMIPMRDGVRLATDVYRPGDGTEPVPGSFPLILQRTPYGKSAEATVGPAEYFCRRGYVAVVQDCRGRFNSEGEYYHFANEAHDGFDAVEWLADQSWCDGKVGTWGGSYLSQVQSAMATQAPPHLAAMVPMYGPSNVYSYGLRHDGAFQLKFFAIGFWLASDSKEAAADQSIQEAFRATSIRDWIWKPQEPEGSPLALTPNYERWTFDFMTRGDYEEFWANPSFNIEAYFEQHSDVPVFLVGGWYDSWSRASATLFSELSKLKKGPIKLLMGPWIHVGHSLTFAGDVDFGATARVDGNLADDFNDWLLRWFDHTLKGLDNCADREPPIKLFVMGGGSGRKNAEGRLDHGGHWRDEYEWPLARTLLTSYYLHAEGALSTRRPGQRDPARSYPYDPEDPVPTIGGNLSALYEMVELAPAQGVLPPVTTRRSIVGAGAADQATFLGGFACKPPYGPLVERKDVLAFQSDPLSDDVEVTGPITVKLWASSTATDTDFTAKLLDIYPPSLDYPQGYHLNVCEGIVRARYRDFSGKAKLLEPGRAYEFEIILEPTSNLFATGHRIRLDISSSNFPRFDVNPNTGEPVGRHTHTVVAENTIYNDAQHPSHVVLPIIPRDRQGGGTRGK